MSSPIKNLAYNIILALKFSKLKILIKVLQSLVQINFSRYYKFGIKEKGDIMKKFLVMTALILIGTCAFAEDAYLINNVSMENFWKQNGIREEKILTVAEKVLYKNKINKRIPLNIVYKSGANSYSQTFTKVVNIQTGLLPYVQNDDELAYVISHEIAHSVEAYGGLIKLAAMNCNSKKYELKSDLKAIDYMVSAGYNPIAAITLSNRVLPEPLYDWGFTSTHPKGSKRIMEMYKYIYKKYPVYLTSEMTKNMSYKNFEYAMEREIKTFEQKEKNRKVKNGDI